ncbi:MAG: cadmium resistance transporter [Spirulina sp.]
MKPILLAILVAVLAFCATNLENLFIVLAYLHHSQYSFWPVSVGYVGAIGGILLGSYGLSQVTLVMPSDRIHYLGLLPIALGIWEFLKLRHRLQNTQPDIPLSIKKVRDSQVMMRVGTVTLVSGLDSLVVFASLFADTRYSADLVIFLTGIGMAVCWVTLAQWLSGYRWISAQLKRFGDVLLPVLLILVGLFILMDTPIDLD